MVTVVRLTRRTPMTKLESSAQCLEMAMPPSKGGVMMMMHVCCLGEVLCGVMCVRYCVCVCARHSMVVIVFAMFIIKLGNLVLALSEQLFSF